MSTPEQRARWRAYSAKRYARMRKSIGRMVHDGLRENGYKDSIVEARHNYVKRSKITIGKCADCELICDEYTVVAFQFDHLDPTKKIANISRMVKSAPIEQIKTEIAKCELVCASCHALRTYYLGHHRNGGNREIIEEINLFTIG